MEFLAGYGITFKLYLCERFLVNFDLHFQRRTDIVAKNLYTRSGTESMSQVKKWLQTCDERHSDCKHDSGAGDPRRLPTRLLAVGYPGGECVRLLASSQISTFVGNSLRYITLSHCWGNNVPTRLLRQNYASLFREISINTLPRTFQEAIQVTRLLGIEFLWIDSLCIIQDDYKDWELEASRMHNVYRYSYLNLASTFSKDSYGGLLHSRSPLEFVPCYVRIGNAQNERTVVSNYEFERTRHSPEPPLLTRGWVFQEYLLAPRLLEFGEDELSWECQTTRASEVLPNGEGLIWDATISNEGPDQEWGGRRIRWNRLYSKQPQERFELWGRIIGEYSKKQLTRSSDKLVALGGLAAELGAYWEEAEYFAGHWSYRFRNSLLWKAEDSGIRDYQDTLPSWSWASIKGQVRVTPRYPPSLGLAEILEVRVATAQRSQLYGHPISGYVHLKAPLAFVILRRSYQRKGAFNGVWKMFPSYLNIRDTYGQTKAEFNHATVDVRLDVKWDELSMEYMAETVGIYLVPLEISLYSINGGLTLYGLIIQPTYTTKGNFRRLGLFQVSDSLAEDPDFQSESAGDTSLDREESDTSRRSKACEGFNNDWQSETSMLHDDLSLEAVDDESIPITSSRLKNISPLEIQEVCETLIIPKSQPALTTHDFKEKMNKIEQRMRANSGGGREEDSLSDPYHNGNIECDFIRHYDDVLHVDEYPRIAGFLVMFSELARRQKSSQEDCPPLSDYILSAVDDIFLI
ncbi:heterokaryon incompatibility protein-domain-containing protein [Bisporella sp. PMI_857]|nr:heterokaryon incompatibility protein-domain-containing protein [Bisporella sp. PMI_857]